MKPTVIITGATKGLGRATAIEFAKASHDVIGLYSTDENAAAQLRNELNDISAKAIVVKHDVCNADENFWRRDEIQQAAELVLINNASASFTPQPFHLLNWNDFENALNTNLKGSWLGSRALLQSMARKGRGTIVNVLTTAVRDLPPKGFSAYAVSKHALRGLTLALAAEYASRGIRVFSVSPGFMATALTAGWDSRFVEAIRAGTTASEPREVAIKIRELVKDPGTAGRGEDYSV